MQEGKARVVAGIGCTFISLILLFGIYWIFKSTLNRDSNTSVSDTNDPYEVLYNSFSGIHDKSDVQPMLEAVLLTHHIKITDENILYFGNMLVKLKSMSKVDVTEMEILKHMYQHGSSKFSLDQQAAFSATVLERSK